MKPNRSIIKKISIIVSILLVVFWFGITHFLKNHTAISRCYNIEKIKKRVTYEFLKNYLEVKLQNDGSDGRFVQYSFWDNYNSLLPGPMIAIYDSELNLFVKIKCQFDSEEFISLD